MVQLELRCTGLGTTIGDLQGQHKTAHSRKRVVRAQTSLLNDKPVELHRGGIDAVKLENLITELTVVDDKIVYHELVLNAVKLQQHLLEDYLVERQVVNQEPVDLLDLQKGFLYQGVF